jgi:hypothetical protein
MVTRIISIGLNICIHLIGMTMLVGQELDLDFLIISGGHIALGNIIVVHSGSNTASTLKIGI